MKIKSYFVLSLIIACFIGLLARAAEVVGKSIALINGEAIYLSEFNSNWKGFLEQKRKMEPTSPITPEWEAEQKKLLLEQMIEEKLLLQEAKRRNVKVQKRQLEEGIRQVKNRFKILEKGRPPTKEDYERDLTPKEKSEFLLELKSQRLSEKEFESKIEDQLRIVRLTEEEVRGRIPAPLKGNKPLDEGEEDKRELSPEYEKETVELFGKIKKKFNDKNFKPNPDEELDQMVELLHSKLGDMVRASHILVKSQRNDDFKKRSEALNKAKSIKAQLDKGADFEELATQSSDGTTAKKGGDLGYFGRGQMVPEFEKTAFSLAVGGISDVVETEFGYHVIKVTEKKAGRPLKYEDIKMDLAGYLYQKRGQEQYDKYVSELRKKADIKITMDFDKSDDS